MKLIIKTKKLELYFEDPKNEVIKDSYDLNKILEKISKHKDVKKQTN